MVGHRGMLGRVVRRYLADRGHIVGTTELRFAGGAGDPLVEAVSRSGARVVINCAGALPSRISVIDELIRSNVLLPQQLGASLQDGQLLIHASSDGVYDGRRGSYDRDEAPNASDTYGISKRLGELARFLAPTIVIRTSIVGSGGSLLRWLMEQDGDVDGYTNHIWNGITTLEWARVCADLIDRAGSAPTGIEHVTSNQPVSKFELLETAAQVYGLGVNVRPTEDGQRIDRALIPTIALAPIRAQLEHLRDWERTAG